MNSHSDFQTPVRALFAFLESRGASLACAESCTGGALGGAITDVAGASRFFRGGGICYDNAVKARILGVPAETLQTHGAESLPCAQAMAQGACEKWEADFALSTTGFLDGERGGEIYFGFARRGGKALSLQSRFCGGRLGVKAQAVRFALENALQVFPKL